MPCICGNPIMIVPADHMNSELNLCSDCYERLQKEDPYYFAKLESQWQDLLRKEEQW